jgi:hypothetical protein
MRHAVLIKSFTIALLAALGVGSQQSYGMCGGTTVLWHNLSDTGCNGNVSEGITADVTDQNIDIIGVNALVDGINVAAITCDILITVTNGDAVLTGSGNRCDGVLTGSAQLYLFADTGRTITFQLENDLVFRGTQSGGAPLDLLVTVSGGGQVIFNLVDGSDVSFTSDGVGGGTFVAVFMDADADNQPDLVFQRGSDDDTDVNVTVGAGSTLTYIAEGNDPADEVGSIIFNGTNPLTNTGLLILNVEDGGNVNIGGHLVATVALREITLGDIDLTVVAGLSANFIVENDDTDNAVSILRVINDNSGCVNLRYDPFCTEDFDETGTQTGFILGPAGFLSLGDITYIDYIGTTTNTCCEFFLADDCDVPQLQTRLRNGSAFIVDGDSDNLTTSTIQFNGASAIYFRSGVDKCGNVDDDFLVAFDLLSPCAGNIVFDVEGKLDVIGDPDGSGAINILSLEVTATGCPIFVERSETQFPARTFARDANGQYLRYNKGAMLVNNRVNFIDAAIVHTDENHLVFEQQNLGDSNLVSEPTYIGGDSYLFVCHLGEARPTIAFIGGQFRLHTSAALTGVDLLVPNSIDRDNISTFIFYNNGLCIDKGYGRNLILGTDPCFEETCITTTDQSAHLNVFQESEQADPTIDRLLLQVAPNTTCITEGIDTDITNQFAVQTIYLNAETNISVGVNGAVGVDIDGNTFALTVTSELFVDGSFFSFETQGGALGFPQSSGTTGQGGIFVDTNGVFRVLDNRIANVATMVTKSRNGVIDLPINSVFFDSRVGIAQWQLNMADPAQRIIVAADEELSDYSLDWGAVEKQYCCSTTFTTGCFLPFQFAITPSLCFVPLVTEANLTSLPEVRGSIQQLQILRSRIGDQVHLKVSGGEVGELVFLVGFNSAEAPVGFLVVENEGVLGLGSAHRNVDSLEASIVLGVNGVILCANGNGTVELNEDIIINNICHIVTGTQDFASLLIRSDLPHKLTIKSTGVLDLSSFNTEDKEVVFGGQLTLIAEPGARIVLGGGVLRFTDQAEFLLEQVTRTLPLGTQPSDLDDVRVRMTGNGTVIFEEDASMFIPQDAYFSIETLPTCTTETFITWLINDQASVQIGSAEVPGGAFQVGDADILNDGNIRFQLLIDGPGALFEINRQGFFGLGVGITDKQSAIPNNWLVGCLANVVSTTISVNQGTFQDNQIAIGDSSLASLFAIGNSGEHTFTFDNAAATILGGGNLIKVNCEELDDELIPADLSPTVTTFAGVTADGFLQAGILAGKILLQDASKGAQPLGVTSQALFNYLQTGDYSTQSSPAANYATNRTNRSTAGFVRNGSLISRIDFNQGRILSLTGLPVADDRHSWSIGAVAILLSPLTQDVVSLTEIIGSGIN